MAWLELKCGAPAAHGRSGDLHCPARLPGAVQAGQESRDGKKTCRESGGPIFHHHCHGQEEEELPSPTAPSAAAALRAVLVVVVVVAALRVLDGLLLLLLLLAGAAAAAVASRTAGDHVVRGERDDVDDGRDDHDEAVRRLRQVVDADQQGERNGGGLVEVARERDVGGRQVLHDAELQDVVHQRGQGRAGAEDERGLAVLPDLTHDPGVVRVADPVPVLHGVLQQEHEGEEDDRGGDGVVDHGVEPVQLHGGLQDPGERKIDAP
mmetsp:Transcript_109257/g.284819  ORF Transcript_109257/g.284819 Transcript_109257/m.284819 type:complete len:265 (-) Transcript_109257:716-1510(-)